MAFSFTRNLNKRCSPTRTATVLYLLAVHRLIGAYSRHP